MTTTQISPKTDPKNDPLSARQMGRAAVAVDSGEPVRGSSAKRKRSAQGSPDLVATQVATGVHTATTRKRSRANGEGGVRHDKARGRWVGTITTGYDSDGRQLR